MESLKIIKSNLDEQISNTEIMWEFSLSFQSCNSKGIYDLLHEDGVFFGKYTKENVISVLHTFMYNEITKRWRFITNRGISLDKIYGAEVLEMRFIEPRKSFKVDEDYFVNVKPVFGSPANTEIEEKVVRFCFEFKDGKIFRIESPTKYTQLFPEDYSIN